MSGEVGTASLVVVNDEGQHALWPAVVPVPAGWRTVHGPADPDECLAQVESRWTDIRPRRLAERTGGRTDDKENR